MAVNCRDDYRGHHFRPTGPSLCSPPSPSQTVERAESSLGLTDDRWDDEVAIHESGEPVTLHTAEAELAVTVGPLDAPQSEVVYTADKLDAHTTRLTAVIDEANQSTGSWDFGDDVLLIPIGDGRISVTDQDGNLLAGIEEPWAVDSQGRSVETSYSVQGTTLVQEVSTDESTSYPVVADPKVKLYPGYYQVNFNRNESSMVVGGVGSCYALLSKAEHPAAKALSLACGTLGAYGTARLAAGRCLRVNVAGLPPSPFWTWWPSYPKC